MKLDNTLSKRIIEERREVEFKLFVLNIKERNITELLYMFGLFASENDVKRQLAIVSEIENRIEKGGN